MSRLPRWALLATVVGTLATSSAQAQDGAVTLDFATREVPAGVRLPVAAFVEHELRINDAVTFVLERQKALSLSKPQRDSLQQLQRAMRRERQPHLRELERRYPSPLQAVADAQSLEREAQTRREALLEINARYASLAAAVLEPAQRTQAAVLYRDWQPPAPQRDRAAMRVDRVVPPPQ